MLHPMSFQRPVQLAEKFAFKADAYFIGECSRKLRVQLVRLHMVFMCFLQYNS